MFDSGNVAEKLVALINRRQIAGSRYFSVTHCMLHFEKSARSKESDAELATFHGQFIQTSRHKATPLIVCERTWNVYVPTSPALLDTHATPGE